VQGDERVDVRRHGEIVLATVDRDGGIHVEPGGRQRTGVQLVDLGPPLAPALAVLPSVFPSALPVPFAPLLPSPLAFALPSPFASPLPSSLPVASEPAGWTPSAAPKAATAAASLRASRRDRALRGVDSVWSAIGAPSTGD
jgi:hypothetical protein